MKQMINLKTATRLLGASAISLIAVNGYAQDVTGQVVNIPVGANTEPATAPSLPATGFVISVNGDAITGDNRVVDAVRRTDVALANADVQVTFDGLGAEPRLDLETLGRGPFRTGDTVTVQSALNYPAYVTRGEVRVIDRAALGGPRTVAVLPITPNGQASFQIPEGENLIVVHRVYDAEGRYDETKPLALGQADDRALAEGVEDGSDATARRRIPVHGGAITVSGRGVANGASVVALGETVQPDPSGGFVIQRILPAGDYGVDVRVAGAGQNVDLTRDVTIPAAEWFYVGTGDVTFGQRRGGPGGTENYQTGRLAFYIDGKTDAGTRITGSVDTGEGDLDQIFRRLDERDPRNLLLRVDPDDLYPTYGDDSTIEDRTPTSGKLFLRIEREGNYVQWGDFQGNLSDNTFARNDRKLYGLSGAWATRDQTPAGEPRARVLAYAAQPDQLPQRDVFQGTGGSVFFLEKQDIASATETLSIQLRDPDTGRVEETRLLTAGEDYNINYIQGIVTLTRPLQSAATDGLFADGARTSDVVLVAQYEHTPTATDLDGFAFGGRVEGWATDQLRFGLTGMLDETGANDHRVVGADILYRISDNSDIRLDYARSEGAGFGSTFSADGGLIVDDIAGAGSRGEAIKLDARLGLSDLGFATDGTISGYFERRTEGFATLDAQVTSATGDETFWGLSADIAANNRLTVSAKLDSYENTAGTVELTGNLEAAYQASEQLTYGFGIESTDQQGGTDPGSRTDVAARVSYAVNDELATYVFGQATVDRDGLDANDRYGFGARYALGNGWAFGGEISDGTHGIGGRLTADYADEVGNTRYIGYEVDPGRELQGITLNGRDRGRIVAGASQQVSSTVTSFGENTYDLFGRHQSLTSAYGLTYTPTDALALTTSIEVGRVDDGDTYDFDRQALTFGWRYQDAKTQAAGRIEYRRDDGLQAGTDVTADTFLTTASFSYKFDENQRLIVNSETAVSQTAQAGLVDGNYANLVLGYAYRPIEDDRLNVLARYRYLHDRSGLRDATTDGPRQSTHVVSVDASYDLNPLWTVGGKLGFRRAETAADSTTSFSQNDAWLAVANARYHLVHNWDALVEVRSLNLVQAETSDLSVLGAVYRHVNPNLKVGVGYNFGTFSDDLTDLTYDDKGAFINLIAKF